MAQKMDCHQIQRLIARHYELATTPAEDEKFENHVQFCSQCKRVEDQCHKAMIERIVSSVSKLEKNFRKHK
jgi:hypothetical protein